MRWFKRLWNDEDGFVVSSEMVLLGSLLTVGAVTGATAVRDTTESELSELGQAIGSMNQTYSYSGVCGHSAFTAGSAFYDRLNNQLAVNAEIPHFADRPTVCADVFGTAPNVAVVDPAPTVPPIVAPAPARVVAPPIAPPQQPKPAAPPKAATPPHHHHHHHHAHSGQCCAPPCCAAPCGGCGQAYGYGYGNCCSPCARVSFGAWCPIGAYGGSGMYGYGWGYGGYGLGCCGYGHYGCNTCGHVGCGSCGHAGNACGHANCNRCGQANCNHCGKANCNHCGKQDCHHCCGHHGHVPLVIPQHSREHAPATSAPATSAPTNPAPAPAQSFAPGGSTFYQQYQAPQQPVPTAAVERPTRFGDADLDGLAGMRNLYLLDVSDAGLARLDGLNSLESLHLVGSSVTDAGLSALEGLPNLKELHLIGAAVTDAGLQRLQTMRQLRTLDLRATKVTGAGLSRLAEAMPQVQVAR